MKQYKLPLIALTFILLLTACGSDRNNQASMQAAPSAAAPALSSFSGKRANYSIIKTSSGFIVKDNVGNDGSVTVSGVDHLRFADMSVNLRMGDKVKTLKEADLKSLMELYVAFFNRVPDADGLSYWIDQFNAGMTLEQIAHNFYQAAIYYSAQTGYSDSMSDADFVRLIYKNVLGRFGDLAPPAADVQYWVDELGRGRTKGGMIAVMLVSARSFANDATWGWVTKLLDNKLALANYFAVQQGLNYLTPEESITQTKAIVTAITATDTATATALIAAGDTQFNLSSPVQIFTIATNIGTGVTMAPQSLQVEAGKSAVFTLSLLEGFSHPVISGCEGTLTGTSYAVTSIAHCTISANATPELVKARYVIESVAGDGTPSLGDGGAAIHAMLAAPDRVLASASGAVYIADTNNHRIAVVDTNGKISTYAGRASAENQPLGDNGAATEAVTRFPRALFETADGLFIGDHSYTVRRVRDGIMTHAAIANRGDFILPWSIAVDPTGVIYIADITHHRVLRINRDGTQTTVAGTGVAGTSGDGGPATSAMLDSPRELRFDGAGNLLIGSTKIGLRQLNLTSGIITTRLPQAIGHFDIDANGTFVYAKGHQVVRVYPNTGVEELIAGTGQAGFSGDGGAATSAQLNDVRGISIDRAGNIFVVDAGNNRVRKITVSGVISTFAGNGASTAAMRGVSDTQGLGIDPQGKLFFTDFQYHFLRKIQPDGNSIPIAGKGIQDTSGDGGNPLAATFANPSMIAFDKKGQLFFLDLNYGTGAVRMINPGVNGIVDGSSDESIQTIAGQNVDRNLADNGAADGGTARKAVFTATRDFLLDSKGNLIVADWLGNRIRKISPGADGVFNGGADETITTIAGNGAAGQSGDGGLATSAQLEGPVRIATDANDNIYVFAGVNTTANALRRIDAKTGVISTVRKGFFAWDMVINQAGFLIYTNLASTQVLQLDLTNGKEEVIAGTGVSGYSGDGGDALKASLRGASYLVIDANDQIYVADNGNFRIRRLRKL